MHVAPDAVADERADDRHALALDARLDGVRDVAEAVPGPRLLDGVEQRLLGDLEQLLGDRADLADRERARAVGDPAVERHADVDRDDVAVARARYGPGMPWTTIAFGEAQIDPGKPR